MMIIRPIEPADLPALAEIAVASGHGFTSLPDDINLLTKKIRHSRDAFHQEINEPGDQGYLFVMEDTTTGQVVGTSGIEAAVGLDSPFYHYHLGKITHSSSELGIYNTISTLTLCNDYTGASEICSLFLQDFARKGHNGRLLSRFRMLFMAQHPQRFSDTVIAEMRGVSDEQGQSPFWHWLEQHFFSMEFADAVHRVGMGQKSFVAELMPKYPIYVSLLDPAAQEVIGEVHPQTLPALKLLEAEGFKFRGYVDLFDAGPTVEAQLDNLKTVRDSRLYEVCIGTPEQPADHIVSNTRLSHFRATVAAIDIDHQSQQVTITADVAAALMIIDGDQIRAVSLARQ